jgi:hypothetical protein
LGIFNKNKISKMMKQLITLLAVLFSATTFAQNVGIGENAPIETRLQIKRADSALVLLHNSSFGSDVKSGLFFKSGNSYSGSIITTGSTALQTFRMGFSTFGSPSPSGLVERISISDIGNVGIGNINPLTKLDINGQIKISGGTPGVGKLLESDATGLATWVDKSASFLPAGASGNTLRHTGVGWTANSILYNNGTNIGIGTSAPIYILDINGRARLRYNGATSGLWYNKADNTEASFVGMFNDTTFGFFGSSGWTSGFDVKNGQLGIGTLDPTAALSFANTVGNKINLFGDANVAHYGLGIQGALLQMYSNGSNADIAFGYGKSDLAGFTEQMRIKGNGVVGIGITNPSTAGLVVNKLVGNTNAVFGSNTTGVSIQTSYPGIGFNTYYNGGSIMIANGGAGYIGADPTTGRIVIANTNVNSTAGAYNALQDKMWIANDGTVSLGSSNLGAENTSLGAGYKLKVYGKVLSEEVRVQLKTAWPDYVFEKNYKKLSLEELEKYIEDNKHLPNIPSAKEIEKDGQHLGEIQRKMLEKIEELILYVIELKKEIDLLKSKTNN